MWILKAVSLNRGQGIYVVSSLKDCRDKIAKMCHDRSLTKESHFVIQKYIEAPLLINSRKFDIRVWVLVTQTNEIFWFKEFYARLSTVDFTTGDFANNYVHLTNQAVQ